MQSDKLSFLNHSIILKKHLTKIFFSILVGFLIAFCFKEFIFDHIILVIKNPEFVTYKALCSISYFFNVDALCIENIPISIQNRTLSGQFTTHLIVSLFAGIIMAFPYIVYQIWLFLKPGLNFNEVKIIKKISFWIILLFFTGILFGYFIISPLSINFLANYSISKEISNQIDLNSFINVLLMMVLSTGIIFLFPILVYFLARIGIIDSHFFKKYRRHSIVIILIIAAIITPPDISSQILISIPMIFLYEISIIIAKKYNNEKQ